MNIQTTFSIGEYVIILETGDGAIVEKIQAEINSETEIEEKYQVRKFDGKLVNLLEKDSIKKG